MSASGRSRAALVAHVEEEAASVLALRNVGMDAVGRMAERFDAVARTVAALGAAGEDDRRRWERWARYLGGARPRGREAEAARKRARTHLERFTRRIDGVLSSPRREELSAAFHGAVLAYRSIGLFDDAEALRWQNKLYAAEYRADPPPRREPPSFAARGTPRLVTGPERRVAGIRITGLALYDDGVAAAWQFDPTTAARQRPLALVDALRFEEQPIADAALSDDRGARYHLASSSYQATTRGMRGLTLGVVTFSAESRPAPRRLRLTIGRESLSIPVPAALAE